MDSMQNINEQRVAATKRLLLQLLEMQEASDGKRIQRTQRVAHVMGRVTPEADSTAYVRKRVEGGLSKWEEQADFRVIVDYANGEEDAMALDGESQVILRNMCLQADRDRLAADQKLQGKLAEAEKLRQQGDKSVDKAAEARHEATMLELEIVKQRAVRAAIETELGSVDQGNPHEFKAFTVAISKTCDYCGESIGGLNRKAAKCAACGFTCHAKCQIKVAPSCEGPDPDAKGGFLARFGTKKKKH
ncbi:Protein BZZ1, partial [Linderina pennispora]